MLHIFQRRRRCRPRLEQLEDRLTPATIAVTTFADVVDPNDPKMSLREAITQANTTPEADTIQLKAGVYEMSIAGAGEDGNASGDFDVIHPLTIQGQGATATFIDAAGLDRLFHIIGSFDVKFSRVTLRNGFVPTALGGAIFDPDADVTLSKSTVSGNTASDGGGLYAGNGNITLNRCTVSDNVAAFNGGGVNAQNGDLTLNHSVVRDNSARDGGGIYALGQLLTLTDSSVNGNDARGNGGGIFTITATLTNSTLNGNNADSQAGGILATLATMTGSTVNGNRSAIGGGIYSDEVHLTNTSVTGNSASGDGGGIRTDSGRLDFCNVSNNVAGGNGGGMNLSTSGFVEVADCTLRGNVAQNGGGIDSVDNTLSIDGSVLRGNRARADGGGVRKLNGLLGMDGSTVSSNVASNGGGIFGDARLSLLRSLLSNNRARANGGGLDVKQRTDLINVTLSGNTAISAGGGAYNFGELNLFNVTVSRNAAGSGGGVFCDSLGTANVENTIIAQNSATGGTANGLDVNGTFTSLGHNLIGVIDGGTGFASAGDRVGTADAPKDARLKPLANNGGPTLTHALKADSPAIDHGDNADAGYITDQRGTGFPRIKDGDGDGTATVDIGAFEK